MAIGDFGGFHLGGPGVVVHQSEGLQKKTLFLLLARFLLFFFIGSFAVPDSAMDSRAPGRLLERNLARVSPDAVLVSNDNVVHAVCWYFKRDDVKLLERGGELTYGLAHDDLKSGKPLSFKDLKEMIKKNRGKHPVILILLKKHYKNYADQLPPPVFMDTDRSFVFAVY